MNSPKHIIPVTCVIEREGKYLIVKRKGDKDSWLFPGGKVEYNEHPVQTLYREIKEKVGLDLGKELALVRVYNYTREDGDHSVGLVFLGKALDGDVKLSDDLAEYKWITPEEFKDYKTIDEDIHLANAVYAKDNNLFMHKDKLAE